MDDFYLYVSDSLVYIIKLGDSRYLPLKRTLPDVVKKDMKNVSVFSYLSEVQEALSQKLDPAELFKLNLMDNLIPHVNNPIERP